jgi:hypothetical protein
MAQEKRFDFTTKKTAAYLSKFSQKLSGIVYDTLEPFIRVSRLPRQTHQFGEFIASKRTRVTRAAKLTKALDLVGCH